MFYDYAVTVLAGTTEAVPKEQVLKLTHGIIHRVEIRFRSGTDFTVSVALFYHEHQIYPTNPDSQFKDDGRAIVFDDHLPIETTPHDLKVRAWSPDAGYDHTVYIRIGVLPSWVLTPFAGLGGALRKFLSMVGLRP